MGERHTQAQAERRERTKRSIHCRKEKGALSTPHLSPSAPHGPPVSLFSNLLVLCSIHIYACWRSLWKQSVASPVKHDLRDSSAPRRALYFSAFSPKRTFKFHPARYSLQVSPDTPYCLSWRVMSQWCRGHGAATIRQRTSLSSSSLPAPPLASLPVPWRASVLHRRVIAVLAIERARLEETKDFV